MRQRVLQGLSLFLLWSYTTQSLSSPPESVCLRFHNQWKVADQDRKKLQKKYGIIFIRFNNRGEILAEGLLPPHKSRLINFYKLCMQDGCLFCDANEGSCEAGNCGPKNKDCKPYTGCEGRPLCGEECAYYALSQL